MASDLLRRAACIAHLKKLTRRRIPRFAFGQPGAAHAIHLLQEELTQVMEQLRCATPQDLSRHLTLNHSTDKALKQ